MRIISILTGVAGALLVAAMPAAAVVKVAKYTGTVLYGYDSTGVFGVANASLAGASYVATYAYDKTLGAIQSNGTTTDGGNYDFSYGGAYWGYPGASPIIKATITINGVTRSVGGGYYGFVSTDTSPRVFYDAVERYYDGVTHVENGVYNWSEPVGTSGSLDRNFGPVASSGGYGWTAWSTYDDLTSTYSYGAYAQLQNDGVYWVSDAVPEPASWSLTIAGFGMVGGAMRRRAYSLAT